MTALYATTASSQRCDAELVIVGVRGPDWSDRPLDGVTSNKRFTSGCLERWCARRLLRQVST
jgi:hypothetical protein